MQATNQKGTSFFSENCKVVVDIELMAWIGILMRSMLDNDSLWLVGKLLSI